MMPVSPAAQPQAITLIRSTYSPFGGVERVTLSVIRGLLQKKIKIRLLTLAGQIWPIADPLLTIVPLGLGHGTRLLQAWSFNCAVGRYLANADDGIVWSFDTVTTFSHLHAGGGTHKTFLSVKRTYSSTVSNWVRRVSPFHRYLLHVEKQGFCNPRLVKVRCNSQMVLNDIQKEYQVPQEKMIVIHSGIRWQAMGKVFVDRRRMAQEIYATHQLDPQHQYLLFLGSGFDRKGLDIAVRGLAVMDESYHLMVVGKGDLAAYRRLTDFLGLSKRVHFLGPQANGWRYAAACRALVLPSQYDPFGGAAAEGHAMGIPVLVSDKTGYRDLVLPGVNGVILKTPMQGPYIQDAFTQLQQLIENPHWTCEQFRDHAHQVDDDLILDRLLSEFISIEVSNPA